MNNIYRLYSDGIHTHAIEEVAKLLNLNPTSLVEVKKILVVKE